MSNPYTTTYNKQDTKETLTATLESDFEDKGNGKVVSNVYLDKETVTDKYDTNTDLLDDSLIDLTFTFPPLEELSKIDIDEFTRNVSMNPVDFTVIGDGIFDNLMETACTHLTAQFESGRIHGEEYASAYVDIYKATLQVIANTWTAKAQASAQAALAISQAHLAKAQALKAYIEAKYALPLSRAQLYYVQRQGDVQRAQAQLLSGQLNKLATDMKLTEAQIETEKKKALNVVAQTSLIEAQTETEEKKPANMQAQTDLINAQTTSEGTRQTLMIKQGNLYDAQANNQKSQIASEAMKAKLYARQIEGFNENFKEKILKIMVDGFTVLFSVAKDKFEDAIPMPLGQDTIDAFWSTYVSPDIDAGDASVGPPSELMTISNNDSIFTMLSNLINNLANQIANSQPSTP